MFRLIGTLVYSYNLSKLVMSTVIALSLSCKGIAYFLVTGLGVVRADGLRVAAACKALSNGSSGNGTSELFRC